MSFSRGTRSFSRVVVLEMLHVLGQQRHTVESDPRGVFLEVLRVLGQPSHTIWNTPVRPFGDDERCILQ